MIPEQFRLKNTVKYPTSLIIGGLTKLGLEITDSLLEQGGYVIIVDTYTKDNIEKLKSFPKDALVSFIDYTTIPNLDDELRRLDYVFYFNHEFSDFEAKVSTQQFLSFSNYLDATLALATKFDAKFLLTTSIKAHQLILANQEIGINYGPGSKVSHTVYTNMELQRYGESLTLEYVEKMNLNARIIRLGEIIGDGIDFSDKSPFVELILNAARGEYLRLRKDGLETEWLVHILDAAYGIIKAQFSQNTNGKIYSVCYEHPYTHLSIAYKIQEVDEYAKDIEFYDEKDNLPSLKLYKPAPNLSQIGWNTKVSFDKAIKQSIAAAKIYLLEDSAGGLNKGGVVDKLKAFFDLAEDKKDNGKLASNIDEMGPISRLIEERKKQEELRRQSVEYAASNIKAKRRTRPPRTFGEKLNRALWSGSISLGNMFSFFKHKTPAEVGLMFGIGLLLITVYFFVVSPVVVLARDVLVILPEYNKATTDLSEMNFKNLRYSSGNISASLSDINEVLLSYSGVFNLIGASTQYNESLKAINSYRLFVDGVNDISYSLEPLFDYFDSYKNNTQLRSGTESYLSITENSLDYENLILDQVERIPYLDLGIDKVRKADTQISQVNYNNLPTFISERLLSVNQELKGFVKYLDYLEGSKFIGDLLGVYGTRTYLMLVLDNTKIKPIGGDISAFAIVTVNGGGITEVVVQSPDEIDFNMESVDSEILKSINNRKFTYVDEKEVKLSDLTSISDMNDFAFAISNVFRDTYNREIHGVVTFNYSSLEALLAQFADKYQFQSNGVSFNKPGFLGNLSEAQGSNQTVAEKNKVTSEIFSQVVQNILGDLKNNVGRVFDQFFIELTNQNMMVSTLNLNYSEFVEERNLDGSLIDFADFVVKPGIGDYDSKVVMNSRYPNVSVTTKVLITQDLTLKYTMNMKFPNDSTNQEVSVCLPLFVSNQSIQTKIVPYERVTINANSKEKCIVFKIINEGEVELSWSTSSLSLNNSNTSDNINLELALGKIKGSATTSDYSITLEPGLRLINIDPFIQNNNNNLVFTQSLSSDTVIKLTISK